VRHRKDLGAEDLGSAGDHDLAVSLDRHGARRLSARTEPGEHFARVAKVGVNLPRRGQGGPGSGADQARRHQRGGRHRGHGPDGHRGEYDGIYDAALLKKRRLVVAGPARDAGFDDFALACYLLK
jgi:hypothetical protein